MNTTSPHLAPTSPGEVPKTSLTTSPLAPPLEGRGRRGGWSQRIQTDKAHPSGRGQGPATLAATLDKLTALLDEIRATREELETLRDRLADK